LFAAALLFVGFAVFAGAATPVLVVLLVAVLLVALLLLTRLWLLTIVASDLIRRRLLIRIGRTNPHCFAFGRRRVGLWRAAVGCFDPILHGVARLEAVRARHERVAGRESSALRALEQRFFEDRMANRFAAQPHGRESEVRVAGFHFDWDITGNWMWQALVYSHGGKMMSEDEKTVTFDQDAGKKSIALLGRMVREGGMPDLTPEASRAAFFSGKLGIWTESTSLLRVADEGVAGKFKWRTVRFPVPGPDARLPTGGAAAMMFAADPAQQAAAWKFMKFITGAQGATIMVKGTGYMPPNSLPANDPAMLKNFYAEKPNHLTSLSQQPLMTAWYAFPGENNLKIIQAIKDRLQTVVDKSAAPEAALTAMSADVTKLLPK